MNAPVNSRSIDIPTEFQSCFDRQRAAYLAAPEPTYAQRIADLKSLTRLLKDNKDELVAAINADYGNRSEFETLFAEYFVVLETIADSSQKFEEVDEASAQTRRLHDLSARAQSCHPAAARRCRGHRSLEFPSQPQLLPARRNSGRRQSCDGQDVGKFKSARKGSDARFPKVFSDREACLFRGWRRTRPRDSRHCPSTICCSRDPALPVARSWPTLLATSPLSRLNWAARHLRSSGPDFPIKTAAERILWVKMFNAGQICTNVDYMFLPKGTRKSSSGHCRRLLTERYPDINGKTIRRSSMKGRSPGCRRHWRTPVQRARSSSISQNSRSGREASQIPAAYRAESNRRYGRHAARDFGPILPIKTYTDRQEVA